MNVMTPTDELVQRAAWFKIFSLLFRFPDEEIVELVKTVVAGLPTEVLNVDPRCRARPFKQAIASSEPAEFVTEHRRLFTGVGPRRANRYD